MKDLNGSCKTIPILEENICSNIFADPLGKGNKRKNKPLKLLQIKNASAQEKKPSTQ